MSELIYHYTTASGLLGILRDSQLLATDINFLNDRSEWDYQVDTARSAGLWLDSLSPEPKAEPFAKHWAYWLRNFAILDRTRLHCVACFCSQGDLLSQWRGYAGSEGFAIGFESTTCFNQIHRPRPVIYEPQAQKTLIQSELSQILATWPHRHKQPRHGQFDGVAGAMLEHVSQILARFKNDSFAEEKEWRVWTSAPIGPPYAEPSPAARLNRSRLVPYVPLRFDTSVAHPIKSIVIGPSSDPRSSRRAVSVVLGSLGLQEAIEIHESAIPLRTN